MHNIMGLLNTGMVARFKSSLPFQKKVNMCTYLSRTWYVFSIMLVTWVKCQDIFENGDKNIKPLFDL